MYKPVVLSCIEYIKNADDTSIVDYKVNYYNFDEIRPNEILVWVGCENIPDFELLKSRGIYCIYYNTEPDTIQYKSNEIWTYSKYLFDIYKKYDNTQIIKFVPIICEENVPFVPYSMSSSSNLKLTFIGLLGHRSDKADILYQSSLIKNNLEEVYNLWNDTDFNDYISSQPRIYLNLTKYGTIALPSVRINKLLSHKCIIISEHTNEIDEEYYKEMVYFCDIHEIKNIYRNFTNKTNTELQQEADKIYEKFYNRFYYKNAIQLITEKK
jgi:hypothetical protein